MDAKNEVRRALARLAEAARLSLPEVDDAKMGPLGLAKTILKALPRKSLIAAAPALAGSWLDMLVCETQEVPVEGRAILPGLFPPAAMITLQGGTAEQQAIVHAGAIVSIRPPANHLLLLSPATATASVYEITEAGLRKIADDMGAFVAAEVERALVSTAPKGAKDLPRFGFDDDGDVANWAVIVAGRFLDEPKSQGDVKRIEARVRAWSARTKLPLAYVHLGTTINWGDEDDDSPDYESAPAMIGLVVEHTSGRAPIEVERDRIDRSLPATIPAAFWDELASEHGIGPRDEGIYFACAGWTVASIYDRSAKYDAGGQYFESESKPILSVSAEGTGAKRIDGIDLPRSMWLYATYA